MSLATSLSQAEDSLGESDCWVEAWSMVKSTALDLAIESNDDSECLQIAILGWSSRWLFDEENQKHEEKC